MTDQVTQLTQEVADVKTAEAAAAQRVQAQIDALNATISDLQSHPAAPDLTQQIADLQGIATALNSLVPDTTGGGATGGDSSGGSTRGDTTTPPTSN